MSHPILRRSTLVAAVAAASLLVLVGCAGSAPEAPPAAAPQAAAPAPSAPAPAPEPAKPPSQEEMMAAWQAAMTPGPEHQRLAAFAGTWDAAVSFWMAPGTPPDTSTGTSVNRMVLGGRYLEQHFDGMSQGQPFQGIGYSGYDNVQKKYIGTWMDSMGTGMMNSVGTADAAGGKLVYDAVMWDPMTGKETKAREELVIESPDKHVLAMYAKDAATGQEFKTMEIVFTRKP